MENTYELPIVFNSKIMHYNNYATSFGIINANKIISDKIIIKYFLNLKFKRLKKDLSFKAPYSYHWEYFDKKIFLTYIKNKNFIKDMVVAINNGYYLYMTIDEYYIPNRNNYLFSHDIHDLYIYGYDLKKNAFICVSFNEQQQFKSQLIKFDRFIKAFNHKLQHFVYIGFKLKKELPEIYLDRKKIVKDIKNVITIVSKKKSYLYYIRKSLQEIEFEDDLINMKDIRFLLDQSYALYILGKHYNINYFNTSYSYCKLLMIKAIQFKKNRMLYLIEEMCNIFDKYIVEIRSALTKCIQYFKNKENSLETEDGLETTTVVVK